jgi:hypothetical protein
MTKEQYIRDGGKTIVVILLIYYCSLKLLRLSTLHLMIGLATWWVLALSTYPSIPD